MTVLVRADADETIGTGHVVRCSALVQRLGLATSPVVLVSASLADGTRRRVEDLGWAVRLIDRQPDQSSDARATLASVADLAPLQLTVVDHYGLSDQWERLVRDTTRRLVVVDDLADRPHLCDVLIDPTIAADSWDRYRGLLSPDTSRLLGPAYALLRPEFDAVTPRTRDGQVETLLVFLGGAASAADVIPLVDALAAAGSWGPTTTIVLGDAFVGPQEVHARSVGLDRLTVLDRTDDMPGLLAWADLAIGATGGAQWERCAAGVPTLTVLTADNQSHDAAAFERCGATWHLGRLSEMTETSWTHALQWAVKHPGAIAAMSAAAAGLVADRARAWEGARSTILGSAESVHDEEGTVAP
jgi:UDP-2,4-diacetamido-2,4,6-trideoxy-beta-L-altropyranose hydrolase